jgi:hypothetical protein
VSDPYRLEPAEIDRIFAAKVIPDRFGGSNPETDPLLILSADSQAQERPALASRPSASPGARWCASSAMTCASIIPSTSTYSRPT